MAKMRKRRRKVVKKNSDCARWLRDRPQDRTVLSYRRSAERVTVSGQPYIFQEADGTWSATRFGRYNTAEGLTKKAAKAVAHYMQKTDTEKR